MYKYMIITKGNERNQEDLVYKEEFRVSNPGSQTTPVYEAFSENINKMESHVVHD